MRRDDVQNRPVTTLSVVDQSPVSTGSTGAEALRNSVDLARLADELGYHRYWVAEHHGLPMIASTSPEALVGPIASATERIRVGSGGVMLPHYSSLKVAETWSVLSGLYPGRIDLGIGRAPGTDPHTMFALQRDRRAGAPDDFPEQLAELIAYLDDDFPAGHPFRRLAALPGLPEKPELWLLGTSHQSAVWAAAQGLPYAFADFIQPSDGASARWYREHFEPDGSRAEPYVAVAVTVVCAETDAAAEELATSSRAAFRLLRRGRPTTIPPVAEAIEILAQLDADPYGGPPPARRMIVGSPDTVRSGIEAVAEQYRADEVMLVTITHEHGARRRSYELVARAFALAREA